MQLVLSMGNTICECLKTSPTSAVYLAVKDTFKLAVLSTPDSPNIPQTDAGTTVFHHKLVRHLGMKRMLYEVKTKQATADIHVLDLYQTVTLLGQGCTKLHVYAEQD